jgi:3-oxoacyl-[acyl-carrier protein] reductase
LSRIALITGGAGGIGLATAQRFARDGLRVVLADRNLDQAVAAAKSLGEQHGAVQIDVSDETSVVAAFADVEQRFGPVAVLMTGAGMLGPAGGAERPLIRTTTLGEWEQVFSVNARGTFLCIRELARRREASPVAHGRVITISSTAAQVGGYQANSAYIASKGAVLSLTKAAARELAPLGITANAIAPGPIDTPMLHAARGTAGGDEGFSRLSMIPAGRIGRPEEIAAAAAYLASEDAGFVTGAVLDVNGGLRMQ